MIRQLALALTIAAVSTSSAAQSSRKPTWDDLLKPYVAKTDPAIPVAPPAAAEPAQPMPAVPIAPPQISRPSVDNPALLDRCEYLARGRLPHVMEGARVANITREFISSPTPGFEYWTILVTLDFNGKGLIGSRSICRVWKQGAELLN